MTIKTAGRHRNIPSSNKILLYMHCKLCMESLPRDTSMAEWGEHEVGWTELGIQVWCKRHGINIIHVDFENQKHPANLKGEK